MASESRFPICYEVEDIPLSLAAETLEGVFGKGDVEGTLALLVEGAETYQLIAFLSP